MRLKNRQLKKLGFMPHVTDSFEKPVRPKRKTTGFGESIVEKRKLKENFKFNNSQHRQFIKSVKNSPTKVDAFKLLYNRLDLVVCVYTQNPQNLALVRQNIYHGHVFVNDVCQRCASFECGPTDVITFKCWSGKIKNRVKKQKNGYFAIPMR